MLDGEPRRVRLPTSHVINKERCQAIIGRGAKRHQCRRGVVAVDDGGARFCWQHEKEINGA